MLELVSDISQKKESQERLTENLKKLLNKKSFHNLGYQGGNVDREVHWLNNGRLWVAFDQIEVGTRRYGNAFGEYQKDSRTLPILAEINIPVETNSSRTSGYFAKDRETGDILLMHSGKIGGGRPGIGKKKFLEYSSDIRLVEVSDEKGGIREGIEVAKLDDPDLAEHIWTFVQTVREFKNHATA